MTAVLERPRRRNSADWDAGTYHSSVNASAEEWEKALAASPDVMWQMIADIIKVAKAGASPTRTGRRPAAVVHSLDELWATLYPVRFSVEPFPVALGGLVKGGQRAFAARVPCNQATLSRLLAGRLTPEMSTMEALARVGDVPPTYFVEYRARRVGQLVIDILIDNPRFSVEMFKRFAKVRP